MILSRRSGWPLRGIVVVMAVALGPVIAGCEAGANAPTQQWHQPTPGASKVVDNAIRINNMFVLGAPPASSLTAGSSAGVFFAISNEGAPDKLVSISAPGTATSVTLPGGGISLASQQSVFLTGPAPQVVMENLTRSLNGGAAIKVVMNFQKAGAVTLEVPVMPKAQYYATFSPAPQSPSPTPTDPGKHHPSPSPATASPVPSPTATPTA